MSRGHPPGAKSRDSLARQYVPVKPDVLYRTRVMTGLGRAQLAQQVGATPSAYWRWENGTSLVKRDTFERLCAVLKIDPIRLVGGEEEWEKAKVHQAERRAAQSYLRGSDA